MTKQWQDLKKLGHKEKEKQRRERVQLETLEKAIAQKVSGEYRATVFIDGIDKKKAAELTNALRIRSVRLEMVRARRDESEPLIRLADMWAGCIRAAIIGSASARVLYEQAIRSRYMIEITK